MKKRNSKPQLLKDLWKMQVKAHRDGYLLSLSDAFALGYMAGKTNLGKLIANEDEVKSAIRKYDDTDDLMLLDTVGETLIDLKVINLKEGDGI